MTNPQRRTLLNGLLALGLGAIAPFATGESRRAPALPILGRWPSEDRRLAPASVIGNGVVFAGESRLGLLDLSRESMTWNIRHHLPGGARFRPRTAAEIVICGGQSEIAAWRPGETQALWRYRARDQIGAPCLNGESVCFGDGHRLLVLDAESGRPRWHFDAIADTRISYAPVVAGDTLYVGPGDGRLYALSLTDGQLRWQVNRIDEWQYLRQLHVDGSSLIAGSYKEKLHGLDLANGQQTWEFSAGNFINSHHVAAGLAFLWSPTGWIFAIDTATGKTRWRHRTTDYRDSQRNWGALMAELTSDASSVYALDLNHVLHVLAREDGRSRGDFKLPEPVRPFVTLIDENRLLCASNSGDLLLMRIPG